MVIRFVFCIRSLCQQDTFWKCKIRLFDAIDFLMCFILIVNSQGALTLAHVMHIISYFVTRLSSGKKFDVLQAERPTNRRNAFGNRLKDLGNISVNALQSALNFGVVSQLVATSLDNKSQIAESCETSAGRDSSSLEESSFTANFASTSKVRDVLLCTREPSTRHMRIWNFERATATTSKKMKLWWKAPARPTKVRPRQGGNKPNANRKDLLY